MSNSKEQFVQSKAATHSDSLHSLDLIVPSGSQIFPHNCSQDHGDAMVMAKPNYDLVWHSAPQHEGSGALAPLREHSPGALTPLHDVGSPEGNFSGLYSAELSPHSRNYEVVLHDPHSRKVLVGPYFNPDFAQSIINTALFIPSDRCPTT